MRNSHNLEYTGYVTRLAIRVCLSDDFCFHIKDSLGADWSTIPGFTSVLVTPSWGRRCFMVLWFSYHYSTPPSDCSEWLAKVYRPTHLLTWTCCCSWDTARLGSSYCRCKFVDVTNKIALHKTWLRWLNNISSWQLATCHTLVILTASITVYHMYMYYSITVYYMNALISF